MYKMLGANIKLGEWSNYDAYTLLHRWQEVKSANRDFLWRLRRNFQYYSALQTPDVIKNIWLKELCELGVDPKNYNLIQMYVDGHAGNLSNYITSPRFVTHESEYDEQISNLQEIYYEDANLFGYEKSLNESIQNSCIISGVEEIKIVRSRKYPLGRIKFESIFPSLILFDPAVRGNDIARESKIAFKEFYMSPKEASMYFPNRVDDIKASIETHPDYENQVVGEKTQLREQLIWNNKMQLLEVYVIEPTFAHVEYDNENKMFIPQTGFKIGSDQDKVSKMKWATSKDISISPLVSTTKIIEDTLFVKTFIPQIGVMLENRKDERQLRDAEGKTHLPFYCHSFMTAAGVRSGVPDQAIHAQDDINLRELTKSKMLHKTPQGKWVIHESLHGGDPAKKSKINQELSDPTTTLDVPAEVPPALASSMVNFVSPTPLNPEIIRDENQKILLLDKLLKMPPAVQGAYGKSGESALLHSRKVLEANIMLKSVIDRFNDYQMNKYQDYKQLAFQVYGGDTDAQKQANLNRTFLTTEKKIIINKLTGVNEDGSVEVENNFSDIDPDKVIVTAEKKNAYMRQLRRETDFTILQGLQPTETNMGSRAILEGDLLKNVESISNEDKELIDQMVDLTVSLSKSQLVLKNYEVEQQIKTLVGQSRAVEQQQQLQESQLEAANQAQSQAQNQLPPEQSPELDQLQLAQQLQAIRQQ